MTLMGIRRASMPNIDKAKVIDLELIKQITAKQPVNINFAGGYHLNKNECEMLA